MKRRSEGSGNIRYSISLLDGAACTFNFLSNARSGRRRLTVSESDVKEEGREPAWTASTGETGQPTNPRVTVLPVLTWLTLDDTSFLSN